MLSVHLFAREEKTERKIPVVTFTVGFLRVNKLGKRVLVWATAGGQWTCWSCSNNELQRPHAGCHAERMRPTVRHQAGCGDLHLTRKFYCNLRQQSLSIAIPVRRATESLCLASRRPNGSDRVGSDHRSFKVLCVRQKLFCQARGTSKIRLDY
ncbi:hypothetical protein CPB85DRAFT_215975 [Mucidula mucida]|nr:hypothetical protein CPB85DRAFT_215975 [Mucidula mucida]